ncbi:uncharacterized protein LOC124164868 [Ischnura elegans]|uniref:uncharacterized protein LOC124164868 n=1 Tax=Ischnura elegans TaxID=197161 RepID=UPI001ED8AED9|nr:uncharacterized protein LOC124164868 [Ischnura elegans]
MTVFYVTFSMPFFFKSLEDDQKKNDKTQLEKQYPGVSYTLQYELMPKGMVYTADVTCWGPVAQVTTLENNYTFKTVRHKDYNWVIFSIGHKANVEKQNIIDMINNEISIGISPAKTTATKGKKGKKEKKKKKE